LYDQQKNDDLARKHYEQALALDANDYGVANNLAWIYAKQGKNLDVALGLAQKAKQLQPDNPVATDTLAWVQYKKGLYAGAVQLLQDCVNKAPQTPTYHFHFGMALIGSGDKKRADQELQTALRLNLSGEDADLARATLKGN
jgi:Flp pilus assembly protein TadD